MLNPQQAQEQLKTFYTPNWRQLRQEKAAVLPDALRPIALDLIGTEESRSPYWGGWRERPTPQHEAITKLSTLPTDQRLLIFESVFPKIGRYVEAGWQLQARLPYQSGYSRKAFRAANQLEVIHHSRVGWMLQLIVSVMGYEQDIAWFAAWAPHLGWNAPNALGVLFAAAIESGTSESQTVFDILIASANGEHPIGAMGRHVPRALLIAARPDGWEFIERYLLAAQRQEGLRQVVLETIDETHPEAFRRMLRLILDQDLIRFSATVRATSVWFGFQLDVSQQRAIKQLLEKTLNFLDDANARQRAFEQGSAEEVFLALWSIAFENADEAIEPANALLGDPNVERRFAAAYLLSLLGLDPARKALLPLLDDPDLRVARLALVNVPQTTPDLFERLERQLPRWPQTRQMLDPIVWPWMVQPADRAEVVDALANCRGDRPFNRLIPYVPFMTSYAQIRVIQELKKQQVWDEPARELFLTLVGDPSHSIREQALAVVAEHDLSEAEVQHLEDLLARKASDLRRGLLSILLKQKDDAAQATVQRLLNASQANQRLAGLEMARLLVEAERLVEPCRQLTSQYQAGRKKLDQFEVDLIETILNPTGRPATLTDGLGLFDPARRTPSTPPQFHPDREPFVTPPALACLRSLEELIEQHKQDPVTLTGWYGSQEQILGNLNYGLPEPDSKVSAEKDAERLVRADLWQNWEISREATLRDVDDLELVRAWVTTNRRYRYGQMPAWVAEISQRINGDLPKLHYEPLIHSILTWLIRFQNPLAADLLLDGAEMALALVPAEKHVPEPNPNQLYQTDWRADTHLTNWLAAARHFRHLCPSNWSTQHAVRLWQIEHWLDEPGVDIPRARPSLYDVIVAYRANAATETDLLEQLIGPRPSRGQYYSSGTFQELHNLSARTAIRQTQTHYYRSGNWRAEGLNEADLAFVKSLVDRCRNRILEVEVARGEMPTAASEAALSLRWSGGLSVLVRLLRAMGSLKFVRGWTYDSLSKAAVFSHLVRATFPAEADTPEAFATEMKAAGISQHRLIDLAIYAPQWAGHVEHVLNWPGLVEGAWWIHAHTKDNQWRVEQEIRDVWRAEVAERTPLSAEDLQQGAVDVGWFNRVYSHLKPQRWAELYDSAEFASGGLGHARAKLFAAAMLGEVTAIDLIARIKTKRHQDSVRALGLLPLPKGAKAEAEILRRYQAIQDFLSTGKKFGSQRRESEKLAARIAMDNLARTAGYADPARLQWAMEAKEIGDMAKGSLTARVGEVTVTLSINPLGEAELAVSKRDKPLKAIPPAVKKDAAIAAVLERKAMLEKQTARMRRSLEEAMCLGQTFTGSDLQVMFTHPVLAVMLEQLVFTGDGLTGYAAKKGKGLMRPDGDIIPLRKNDVLRIAHPHDLWAGKDWHTWQKECFQHERIQPFKQIYRELYVLTEAERTDAIISRRYAGHQVNPRQAVALLGDRGWIVRPEEGAGRTFHAEEITAYLAGLGLTFSPADVEGATLEGVVFYKQGAPQPMRLVDVPPRLFSEVMRDLDLVVSVAHMGGVDPEASASTVEMRATLIDETSRLLKLKNVRVQKSHVLIEGQLASYSVHLGSAVVHRQPGGSLCIVPVHGQHRGRLFLPFVDDDPRTAEVVSKVVLLAKDSEIKDPTILEQILN